MPCSEHGFQLSFSRWDYVEFLPVFFFKCGHLNYFHMLIISRVSWYIHGANYAGHNWLSQNVAYKNYQGV